MLIVVVYIALESGPVTGLLAGTVGGLIQDALSSGILGIGGLAKTMVGFLAGRARHAVHRDRRRCRGSWCSLLATALHAAIFMGLYVLLGPAAVPGPATRPSSGQALGNGVRRRGGVPADRVAARASSTGAAPGGR